MQSKILFTLSKQMINLNIKKGKMSLFIEKKCLAVL